MIVLGGNFNITDREQFNKSVESIRNSVATPGHFYCSDNMITWNKNFSFMTDKKFMEVMKKNATSDLELTIIWRTYVVCYFAKLARRLPGDFMEIGAYKGNTANVVIERIDFESTDKRYWLYDAFEHVGTEINHSMPEHGKDLYAKVKERFAAYPFVEVVKGYVPESFDQGFPEQIAFAHVDLNQAPAEVAALRRIIPRMVSGSILILDDYGWFGYAAQKEAEDPLLAEYGLDVLELPTGQGIVIIP